MGHKRKLTEGVWKTMIRAGCASARKRTAHLQKTIYESPIEPTC